MLIVDDDPHLRVLLKFAAEQSGLFAPIAVTDDGRSALEALHAADRGKLPQLIVTDLSMPRMTGLELVRAVKGDPALQRIPIGVITSSDVPNDREVALAAGACAFEPKPYGLEALIKTLLSIRDSCVGAENQAAARNFATS